MKYFFTYIAQKANNLYIIGGAEIIVVRMVPCAGLYCKCNNINDPISPYNATPALQKN